MFPDVQMKATPSMMAAHQRAGRALRMMPQPRRAVGIAFFKVPKLWQVRFDRPITALKEESMLEIWCVNNCEGWWDVSHSVCRFEQEDDAKLFYLRFA